MPYIVCLVTLCYKKRGTQGVAMKNSLFRPDESFFYFSFFWDALPTYVSVILLVEYHPPSMYYEKLTISLMLATSGLK